MLLRGGALHTLVCTAPSAPPCCASVFRLYQQRRVEPNGRNKHADRQMTAIPAERPGEPSGEACGRQLMQRTRPRQVDLLHGAPQCASGIECGCPAHSALSQAMILSHGLQNFIINPKLREAEANLGHQHLPDLLLLLRCTCKSSLRSDT